MNSDIRFGLILALTVNGLAVSAYRDMVAVSQKAERCGFDSVWLCDHFLTISPDDYVKDAGIADKSIGADPAEPPASLPLLECWTALSALARDTTRLRLGTSVLCNSYRHPSVLRRWPRRSTSSPRDGSISAWAPAGSSASSRPTASRFHQCATGSRPLPSRWK
jgi:hypothetical protein